MSHTTLNPEYKPQLNYGNLIISELYYNRNNLQMKSHELHNKIDSYKAMRASRYRNCFITNLDIISEQMTSWLYVIGFVRWSYKYGKLLLSYEKNKYSISYIDEAIARYEEEVKEVDGRLFCILSEIDEYHDNRNNGQHNYQDTEHMENSQYEIISS